MLNENFFQYYFRTIKFCRKVGCIPFHFNRKTKKLFLAKKDVHRTRSKFVVHPTFTFYCHIKSILLSGEVDALNFCLSTAYAITLNCLIWIPTAIYESDFAAFMNCTFRFISEYQSESNLTLD